RFLSTGTVLHNGAPCIDRTDGYDKPKNHLPRLVRLATKTTISPQRVTELFHKYCSSLGLDEPLWQI
ncbi:hypothetical protein REH81_23980, partial [Vibrio rotiferianus]